MRQYWLSLALIACAMRATPLAAQSSMTALPSTAEPRAQLRSNALGDPQVMLFKPSYVTVFEVVPYAGIAQLYPLSTAEGAELLKEETLTLSASRTTEARRVSARGVRLVSSGMGTNAQRGGRTRASSMRPRSMVLLASDHPFRVGSPDVTLGQLALQMTGLRVPRVFVGEDEDIAMLVARVRPLSPEADVTIDVLALPPDASDVSSATTGASTSATLASEPIPYEIVAVCGVSNVALPAELVAKLQCAVASPFTDRELGLEADKAAVTPANPVPVSNAPPAAPKRVDERAMPERAMPEKPAPVSAASPPPPAPQRAPSPATASREKPLP